MKKSTHYLSYQFTESSYQRARSSLPIFFFIYLTIAVFTNVQAQNFTWSTASDAGTTVSETVNGITATVSTSNSDAQVVNGSGFDGSSGNVVFTQNADTSTSLTITFSQAVDVASIFAFIADNDSGADSSVVFTPTGGSNSAVTEGISQFAGEVVSLNFTGVTAITLTESGGGFETFGIDEIVIGIPNSAPIATAPSAPTVLEDATNVALANDIQVTDTDGDDQTLTFTITGGTVALGTTGITFGGSGNGSASFTAQGTLANINAALDAATFTPTANLNGNNAGGISFIANDNTDNSNTASVTFTINAVNDEPSFTAGVNEIVNEDAGAQTVNGWATAIDDGDADATQTLTFTVTNDNNALFSAQPAIDAMGNLTYTPAANASGSATVDVVLSDNGGTANGGDDTFATQQFTITVNAVNDEPSFTAGANEAVNEDAGAQTVNGWATAIDDGDSDATQTLTFTVVNNNNALFSAQPAIDATGNLTYTPATDASGSATVSVVLSDDGGTANGGDDTFATQQFTITVNAVNDEPSFTAGANEAVNEDAGAQTVNGWATAIDDGDADAMQTLSFNVSNDNNALFSVQPAIDATGNLTYTPAADANGSATVSVVLSDDGGTANGGDDTFATQQFTITVNAVNDEPSFTAGANEAVNEDAGAQTVNGWATAIDDGDSDATQTLTFTVVNNNNALFSAQPAIDATGNLTYTPATDASGSATVSVVLSDDGGTANGGDDTFATQQFTITVNAVNDEPSFTAGANEAVNEDAGTQTVNGWATAIDDGDADAVQTLSFNVSNDNNALFSVQPSIDATGNLTYTPAANTNGSATVTVSISDDGGTANGGDDTSDDQTFTITVNAVNDEPSFTAGANEAVNEDAGAQTVNGWATAIDDGDADAMQTLSFNVSNDNNALFSVQPSIDATGNLTYTPAADANGSATVTVSISDDGGTANGGDDTSDDQIFTITVNAVNDEPSFTAGANEAVNEDAAAQTVNGWATAIDDGDADAMQTLSFNVSNDNNALFSAQPSIDATGNLTYTPAANTNGSATVTVSISDDGGTANSGDDTSDDQTFTITVNAVNDEPSFTAGANEAVNEDAGAQTVNGWATAIDDGDADAMQTLSFNVSNDNNALFSSQPAIDATGNLTYTPTANANGSTTVTVSISDDGGTASGGDDTSDDQTFTITVDSVNDEPSFTAGANEIVSENAGAQTVNGWATAIDDGDPEVMQTLTFTVTNSNNALFSSQPAIDATGNLTYTPATDATGVVTVSVVLTDDGGTANGGDDTFAQQFAITITDATPPTVDITSTESSPTGANPIPVTITFSEPIDNLDIANIIVGNGTASNLSPLVSNTVYTVNINPTSTGIVTVDINANVSFDAAGNGNTAATQFSIESDITRPSVIISSTVNSPTSVNPIPITITFSEDIIDFDLSDISVSNGTASNLSGSGASFTVDITPVASGNSNITVIIDENRVSDPVFNGNTISNVFVIEFDSTLSIDDEILSNGLTIYPIPSINTVNISGEISLAIKRADIFDIQGKLVLSQKLNSSSVINTIDISSISSGFYLMTIHSEKGFATKRILKQ
ncbi:Ig-like domain-containing protein [uncultured Aquimarina sp.]|uniref:beta strand repeat-containing protein n=1 Tax=uncultured Aquimarina sp. TaxID=575652 RepID=UPI00261C1EEA|nr:Ig-like domain-containing protein [uncultured Aquimarina sp.]